MRERWFRKAILVIACATGGATLLVAQNTVALSVFGAFGGTTAGNNIQQSPANAAGGMAELRHISNPLIGYEVTYSYNRANQVYVPISYACPVGILPPCGPPTPAPVSANAHEVTGDWVVSLHAANLRPFALVGLGVLLNVPSGGQSNTSISTKPVYVYGAGLDWGLVPHLGLRFQYRGNLYQAPDLTKLYTSSNAFTHTAEPMIGAYFRF